MHCFTLYVNDIENLEDLLQLVFTDEECGLIAGRELSINQKKKPDVLKACRCPLCDKCES